MGSHEPMSLQWSSDRDIWSTFKTASSSSRSTENTRILPAPAVSAGWLWSVH